MFDNYALSEALFTTRSKKNDANSIKPKVTIYKVNLCFTF